MWAETNTEVFPQSALESFFFVYVKGLVELKYIFNKSAILSPGPMQIISRCYHGLHERKQRLRVNYISKLSVSLHYKK